MKRFQELLMKDLGWKLLSVAIAAIMWFMVINITQPVDSRNYSRPLTIENLEALTSRGLTLGNLEELKTLKITTKIKAQRTALDRLNQNPEWVQASIDLSDLTYAIHGDVVSLPVEVSMLGGLSDYDFVSKSPATVEVNVETLSAVEMPVEVVLGGEVAEELYLSEPSLSSETVTVTGPASLVSQVASVRVNINAEELKLNPIVRGSLSCYNAEGGIVKGVSTNVLEVTVSYALLEIKDVPIQVEITGTPAAGYQVGDITSSPATATLKGTEEDLKNIFFLQMDTIDVSGRSSNVSRLFDLEEYLPDGISLLEGTTSVVQIEVEIVPQNGKTFTLHESDLTILGQESGKTYTLGTTHVTISGPEDALHSLTAEQLGASIHVNGLEAGEHQVMLHFDLPEGLSAAPASISVTVSGENEY